MNTALLLFAFLLSIALVGALIQFGPLLGLIDPPNPRSSHSHRCTRGGGLAFVVVWAIGFRLALPSHLFSQLFPVLVGALIVAAVGLWDDLRGIGPLPRLFMQTLGAVIASYPCWHLQFIQVGGTVLTFGFASVPLMVIAIVWSTNLFNFMDGTDGLAAMESMIVFSAASLMFTLSDAPGLSLICGLLVASVGGFLMWNFPRAKIFMGDVGSGFLGFLVAVFALMGEYLVGVPAVLWLILYAYFVTDTFLTLLRRALRGEKFYQAHRLHAYQRLHHGARLSHLQILALSFLLNSLLLVLAWLGFVNNARIAWLLPTAYACCTLYYWIVEQLAPMFDHHRRTLQSSLTVTH